MDRNDPKAVHYRIGGRGEPTACALYDVRVTAAPGEVTCSGCSLVHESAKERNRGVEPDALHLAYEREMRRLRLLAESALRVNRQWRVTSRDRQFRQDWPEMADELDAMRTIHMMVEDQR